MHARTSATTGAGDDLDALSRYDGLQAIRLTTLGSYALALTDTYQPTNSDTANAQPLTGCTGSATPSV